MFFMHRVKCTNGTYDKGIEVKETLDDAKQSYHAYLGAYAYGHDKNTSFVSVAITDDGKNFNVLECENWTPTPVEPVVEPTITE